jgi:diguanylate cyclase (GGDEF)-like protein
MVEIKAPLRRLWPLLAVGILLIGLGMAASAALLWRSSVRAHERQSFQASAADVTATLSSGLRRDVDFIETLRAIVTLDPRLTSGQLSRWYAALEGRKREVGSLVTAVVSNVPASQLAAFQARRLADPAFRKLARGSTTIVPPGRRPRYCLLSAFVTRLAESSLAQLAAHADWCASAIPGTAHALSNSTEAGQLSVSPPVLGTDFVGLAAYRFGAPLATAAERRAATFAWLWSSVDIPSLIRSSIGTHRGFAVTVYHRDPTFGEQLIGKAQAPGPKGTLTRSARLDVDGAWLVRVQGAASVSGMAASAQGVIVFAAGAAMSLLLAALALVLMRSRERALGLADERGGQLVHQALHDALTGLPNRVLALDRAERMLARAARSHRLPAALYIDLDGLGAVNDTFGHRAGDELLKTVAARLSSIVREIDTAARLGGDEFLVLMEGASLNAGAELVAERLLEVLRLPYEIRRPGAPRISVTASIGIAFGHRESAEELLRDAGVALHEAKLAGRNRYVLFESSMHTAVQDRVTLEMDLAEAEQRSELFLLYQPMFDLRSERLVAVEALLRWRHPTRGVIGPDEFIPIAEESGLIVPIGRWVLREACNRLATWRRQGHEIGMSVNVSARQLDSEALLEEVRAALRASSIAPGALTLEVTETTIMRDADATAERLARLKQLGVRIAVDDFGTGYSSLAYLRQFPVDALKIDRTFVREITASRESGALIHTLVALGKALGLRTLAEGIEDEAQLRALQQEGCDYGQGYLLAHPLDADALGELLRAPAGTSRAWYAHRSPQSATPSG